MDILVFHNIEDFRSARSSSTDFIFCFERYAPTHNYLYQNITLPLTEVLRNIDFGAILFESTSLGVVTFRPRSLFSDLRSKICKFTNGSAVKIAFPQDDYNHSALLDEWLSDLHCHAVGTTLYKYRELLYPRTYEHANFFPVLTGYVDDSQLSHRQSLAKPFAERDRLIGQRVTMYPPRGGRFARVKGETAEFLKDAATARGMSVDISTDSNNVLLGDEWYRFLGDCKFCLGSEGGVSLWDPNGDIHDRIEAYLAAKALASFEEVEAACFPRLDGRHTFSAVSPRLFEAAAMGCCQILTEGKYLEPIQPYKHYIPLTEDCSNVDEIFDLMKDESAAQQRIHAMYKALIDNPEFRFSTFVNRIMSYIQSKSDVSRRPNRPVKDCIEARLAHWSELVDRLVKREREIGFSGAALADRVEGLMYSQFAEPFVLSQLKCRDLSAHFKGIVSAERGPACRPWSSAASRTMP